MANVIIRKEETQRCADRIMQQYGVNKHGQGGIIGESY